MKVIGITGGIGTGKSTVARFMVELGAVLIDADKVGHEAFAPRTELWHKVVAAFGESVLAADGQIDRSRLGSAVFGDAKALERLNRIMHPVMYRMVDAQIEQLRQQGTGVVVLEAALLVEAGWKPLVDEVWVTVASEETVLQRLKGRSGMTPEEALSRIRAQLPAAERARHADVLIDTDCTLDEVRARVRGLWQRVAPEPANQMRVDTQPD